MSLLTILHHPDPRLRRKAKPVEAFDPALQTLIDNMFETMYAAPGVGLAATQVGVDLRLSVMDCSESRDRRMVMINPEMSACEEPMKMEEGCLSVPDVQDTVKRYNRLHLRALDRHGEPYELDAEGLLAQCVQHEIGHLDGKLFVDYLSFLKRDRIRKKLHKQRKTA